MTKEQNEAFNPSSLPTPSKRKAAETKPQIVDVTVKYLKGMRNKFVTRIKFYRGKKLFELLKLVV